MKKTDVGSIGSVEISLAKKKFNNRFYRINILTISVFVKPKNNPFLKKIVKQILFVLQRNIK